MSVEAEEISYDWGVIEEALNAASAGAGDPLYSQMQEALAALFRLGSKAADLEEEASRLRGFLDPHGR